MIQYNTNLPKAACAIVKGNALKIPASAIKEAVMTEPSFPSLLSLSNAFDRLGIVHHAVKVSDDSLSRIPQPFVAYGRLGKVGKDFFYINTIDGDVVWYQNERGRKKKMQVSQFVKQWDQIALYLEQGLQAKSAMLHTNPKTKFWVSWPACIGIAALGILLFVWAISDLSIAFYLLLKLIGVAIAGLLLGYELNHQNEAVRQFCQASKTINCEAVLKSKGARVFGFSWSETGFFYFASSALFGIVAAIGQKVAMLNLLHWATLLAAPYMLYSIYYQWRIVKQWCLLCLAVQGLLLSEAMYVLADTSFLFTFQPTMVWPGVGYLLLFLFVLGSWMALKPLLKKGTTTDNWRYAYQRLANDKNIFFTMLQRQRKVPAGYENCTLLFGDPNAPIELLKVCNPYCGPCSKAHPLLEEIVKNNPGVNLRVAFVSATDMESRVGQVIHHFIAAYMERGDVKAEEIMHHWYTDTVKDLELLKQNFPVDRVIQTEDFRSKMEAWVKTADIKGTPTIFINGHELPKMYNWEELKRVLSKN